MRLAHIKSLLQISCNFNTSSISHSFTIDHKETLTVNCIQETFILVITSDDNEDTEYYDSIDAAADALHQRIHSYVER